MPWRKRWFRNAEAKETRRRQTAETQRALVSWLSRAHWDVFYTQTFRKDLSAEATRALFFSSLAELYSNWGVMAVCWSVEPHSSRRSHHVHSLLATRSPMSWGRSRPQSTTSTVNLKRSRSGRSNTTNNCLLLKEWGWRRFGIARVWPITSDQRTMTTAYVVKYLLKKHSTDTMTAWTEEEVDQMNHDEKLWGVEVSDVRFSPDDPPYAQFFVIDHDRPGCYSSTSERTDT